VKEATGKDPGDFYTGNEVEVLERTGLFEKHFAYTSKTKLYTGDILVTKTKGHTALVVAGETKDKNKVAEPTLRKGDKGTQVGILQENLKSLGYKGKDGKDLEIDDDFGRNTGYALITFQRAKKLDADEIYGPKSADKMQEAINGR
jgi:peptidoglycan hydrolase-like protein with peptidoglycan-binding domain